MTTRVLTAVLVGVLAATPAYAQRGEGRQRHPGGGGAPRGERAVGPRGDARPSAPARAATAPRSGPQRSYNAPRREAPPPRAVQAPRVQERSARPTDSRYRGNTYGSTGRHAVPRSHAYPPPRVVEHRYYAPPRVVSPGYRAYPYRGYYGRTVIVPRVIRPRIITVDPYYRPYYYRPSLSVGVYYGAGGAYPYGYTPRGYYDPLPGVAYGGVRITDAPRDAQVFADGYYVGIVDDFDGIFQHLNLEGGAHRIEIHAPGYEPVAFDVYVEPGRTITLRADAY